MLRPATHIRYHITAILAVHWLQFAAQYKRWIRPVVFENVRKVLACRTPVLGCHIYQCKDCGHLELIAHCCKSRFCPTCGKHATDVWANQVLNALLDVPYHHLIMAIPWQLRIVIIMNRRAGLNLDGKRWIETDPKFLMYHGGLKKRWKYQVTTRMKRAHREGQWRFPKSKDFLKQYPLLVVLFATFLISTLL
jgi:hypothetical protein